MRYMKSHLGPFGRNQICWIFDFCRFRYAVIVRLSTGSVEQVDATPLRKRTGTHYQTISKGSNLYFSQIINFYTAIFSNLTLGNRNFVPGITFVQKLYDLDRLSKRIKNFCRTTKFAHLIGCQGGNKFLGIKKINLTANQVNEFRRPTQIFDVLWKAISVI